MEKDGEPYYFSLNFNLAGEALPPASGKDIVLHDPKLAWGIIAFDAWTMNIDRHSQNIAFDKASGQVQIFDHSHAFAGESGDARATLTTRSTGLLLGTHCVAAAINTFDGLNVWCDRVANVPDYFIDGIVDVACDFGLPSAVRELAASTLKTRKLSIESLLRSNLAAFPCLPRGAS